VVGAARDAGQLTEPPDRHRRVLADHLEVLEGAGQPCAISGSLWGVSTGRGPITKQAIRRGTFTSISQLIQRIRDYVQYWNTSAEPFVWTATADEILAKVRWVETNIKQLVAQQLEVAETESRDREGARYVREICEICETMEHVQHGELHTTASTKRSRPLMVPLRPVAPALPSQLLAHAISLTGAARGIESRPGHAMPSRGTSATDLSRMSRDRTCPVANSQCFPAGNIALVQRGTCTFGIKATNAKAAGASAHRDLQ
jgi:PA domain